MKKISPVLQMSSTECGLCVTIMMMDYYGVAINIHDITKFFSIGRDGSSIKDLKTIFAHYNFKSFLYNVKNSLSQIQPQALPCIAYKSRGHFVVIETISTNNVTILDPVIGRVKISKTELDREYKNIILKIEPDDNFKKMNTRGNEFYIIKEALVSNKSLLYKLGIVTVLVYAITLLIPILLKKVVDIFLMTNVLNSQIKIISLSILVSSIAYLMINKIKLLFSVNLSVSIDKFLTNKVISKLFKNKFEYFITRTSSDIQYRLALLKGLKTIISTVIIQTILDIGSMIVIFVYIASIQIAYSLILLLFTIIVITLSLLIRNKMLLYKNKELSADNKLQVLQYDIFRSIFDVKVLGLSQTKHKVWKEYYSDYISAHKTSQLFLSNYQNVLSYVTIYFPLFIPLVGIWISGTVNNNQIGTIISLQSLTGIYVSGLISISQLTDNFTSLKSYITRINDVLMQEDEINRSKKINFRGNIEVKNLSFKYPGGKESILSNISFSIREGEEVAIVGESGSGKSTLFYILLGAYDNYEGQIMYDGVNFQELSKDNFREQISVVPQNPLLFSGTIRENLIQDSYYDDKYIYEVLSKVSMSEFIKSLPMGLDTLISENGFNISGGQKQRIALARSIINKSSIFFLDEATSSLDNITEHTIVDYLSKQAKTKIVIAHRLGTIKNSNKIIVLRDGKIVEVGNHQQLMKNKKHYYQMYCGDVEKSI